NGTATDSGYAQDINFNGASNDSPFAGFNDWASISLEQVGARRNVLGFSSDVWGSEDITGGGSEDITGGGSEDITGGGSEDITGGGEADFDNANSTVDPPQNLNAMQVGHSVNLAWSAPDFGQIRTYYIWRAVGAISLSNVPDNIGKVSGTPAGTTFPDTKVKNNTTYCYFVTAALGNGNQSGQSNNQCVAIIF